MSILLFIPCARPKFIKVQPITKKPAGGFSRRLDYLDIISFCLPFFQTFLVHVTRSIGKISPCENSLLRKQVTYQKQAEFQNITSFFSNMKFWSIDLSNACQHVATIMFQHYLFLLTVSSRTLEKHEIGWDGAT